MKIAYLITRADEWGGAQVHVRDLLLWMKGQGHEVILLSGAPGVVSDEVQQYGIPYHEIKNLRRDISLAEDIASVFEIRKLLQGLGADLLTCHSSKAGLVGRLGAFLSGTPVVFTAHNWTFGKGGGGMLKRLIFWFLEWFAALFGGHIITVSEFGRTQARRAFVGSDRKVVAIHNGIPDVAVPSAPKIEGAPVKIAMIARIGWPKDHIGLLNSLSECRDLNWTLQLIGAGDQSALKQRAADLNIQERVEFLGERKDIPAILAQQDFLVLTSEWEGFPLSTLEAMRAGLPVIVSNAGGSAEAVDEGQTGYVVPVGDHQTLVARLRTLIENASLRASMGQKGRASFETFFMFDVMARKTLDIYRRVRRNP